MYVAGEGFGKFWSIRQLAEHWAEIQTQAEAFKQTPDDQLAVSESPIVNEADSSMHPNKNWRFIEPDFSMTHSTITDVRQTLGHIPLTRKCNYINALRHWEQSCWWAETPMFLAACPFNESMT